MKKIIVTTSWDDGNKLDIKLAELLDKYRLKGTFYIPQTYERRTLSEKELKDLGQNQEIGAHTVSHAVLTRLNEGEAKKEIFESKKYLENLLGKKIKMFCYPKGELNREIKNLIRESNLLGARTTENFQVKPPKDFFEFGTTLQVYPFPFRKKDANHYHLSRCLLEPLQQKIKPILNLKLSFNSIFNWQNLAKNLFDYTLKNGEIYHLWGHSWEIEKYGMWQELEEILDYIAGRQNVLYLTNSQVLENL